MNLNQCIPGCCYRAAGAGCRVGAAATGRRVAGEIPAVDHPGLSNPPQAALPYSTHEEHPYSYKNVCSFKCHVVFYVLLSVVLRI